MELRQHLAWLRRWAWALALGAILGVLGGYFGSQYQTPVYRASTRILVTRAPQDKVSDLTYLTDQQLTQTYVQLLTTQPVLDAASKRLGYTLDPQQVRVRPIINTQIIQLTFDDNSPLRASLAANTLVKVLIDQNESLQAGRYATTEASLQAQIQQIQNQIDTLQTQINNTSAQVVQDQLKQVQDQINILQAEVYSLQQEIKELTSAASAATPSPDLQTAITEKQARLAQIQPILALYQQVYTNLVVLGKPVAAESAEVGTRLSQLQSTLGLYQQIYINLLNNLEAVKLARLQNTPNVVQIEPAVMPQEPIRPRPLLNTLLAGAIGLLLTAGIALLIEHLDDTLKTHEDVERVLGLPVIGYIGEIEHPAKSGQGVYVMRQPRSPISESFRSLRTNLEFAGVDKPLRTLLITSAGPGEGKTTVSVNLAASMAQGGKSVILLDTDMRRPRVHALMGLPNRFGFSDLFHKKPSFRMVGHEFGSLKDAMVITSGSPPPNPTELLGSERMSHIMNELKEAAEVVILDSPPCIMADTQILAAKVDGVLLIVLPGRTHTEAALAAVEQMKRAGARLVGVVFNRIPKNRSSYYDRYYYYSPTYYDYYAQPASQERAGANQPRLPRATLGSFLHFLRRRKASPPPSPATTWAPRPAAPISAPRRAFTPTPNPRVLPNPTPGDPGHPSRP